MLTAAINGATPSTRSKQYNHVHVLLTYWDIDDLKVHNEVFRLADTFSLGYGYQIEVAMIPALGPDPEFWLSRKLGDLMINHDTNDLLIFYYAGLGQVGRLYGGESPCIFVSGPWDVRMGDGSTDQQQRYLDFSGVKKSTWDRSPADVLYLLDCCNAVTAGIRPGKELIAASSVEGKATEPGPYSLTAALVQELNHAGYSRDPHYLTVAQLYFKMLEKVHTGELMHTPIHVETMFGPQPRTSIFLAPLLRSGATASESVTPSTYPLSGVNLTPLGCRRTDIRVMLSVRLRDGNARTVQELRNWLIMQRPPNIEHPGISFEHAVPSSDSIMVITFIMPVPEWYCLQGSPALTFMAWVRYPAESTTPNCLNVLETSETSHNTYSKDHPTVAAKIGSPAQGPAQGRTPQSGQTRGGGPKGSQGRGGRGGGGGSSAVLPIR
ncbi:MAG: hypothetical protein Q9197_004815 [Variospora fuerteventurae]